MLDQENEIVDAVTLPFEPQAPESQSPSLSEPVHVQKMHIPSERDLLALYDSWNRHAIRYPKSGTSSEITSEHINAMQLRSYIHYLWSSHDRHVIGCYELMPVPRKQQIATMFETNEDVLYGRTTNKDVYLTKIALDGDEAKEFLIQELVEDRATMRVWAECFMEDKAVREVLEQAAYVHLGTKYLQNGNIMSVYSSHSTIGNTEMEGFNRLELAAISKVRVPQAIIIPMLARLQQGQDRSMHRYTQESIEQEIPFLQSILPGENPAVQLRYVPADSDFVAQTRMCEQPALGLLNRKKRRVRMRIPLSLNTRTFTHYFPPNGPVGTITYQLGDVWYVDERKAHIDFSNGGVMDSVFLIYDVDANDEIKNSFAI